MLAERLLFLSGERPVLRLIRGSRLSIPAAPGGGFQFSRLRSVPSGISTSLMRPLVP